MESRAADALELHIDDLRRLTDEDANAIDVSIALVDLWLAQAGLARELAEPERVEALASEASRQNNSTASNYSATVLPVNAQGVPNALLTDAAFALVGVAGNDITLADMGVTVRYVVDRLCVAAGPANPDGCTLAGDVLPAGSSASELLRAEDAGGAAPAIASPVAQQVVYRVSISVTGPRRTQSFFQTTFTI